MTLAVKQCSIWSEGGRQRQRDRHRERERHTESITLAVKRCSI